jgi:uncharacterized protein (TIGR04145 family)
MIAYTAFMTMLILLCSNTREALASPVGITIDGYYDDWADKPYSWEYVWDNPWQVPDYWNGTENITKEYRDENGNPYNLEVRHKMSLLTDGEYVYLHILVSSNPGSGLYADYLEFWIDNEMTAFRITFPNGDSLTNHFDDTDPGNYYVEVRHHQSYLSNTVVGDASAIFTKKYDNMNNEIEVKIPLSAMKLQNNNINLDTFRTIEFFNPSMMYRRISCSGISTAPYIGILISVLFVGAAYFLGRYKSRRKMI